MRISVVGNGYVGLATAVGLAGNGYQVVCIDNNPAKVDLINQGKAYFWTITAWLIDGTKRESPLEEFILRE